jgi:hypothetical protein
MSVNETGVDWIKALPRLPPQDTPDHDAAVVAGYLALL